MKVQARAANVKRHTVGWKIGGKWRSRSEAVRLAKRGKVDGVTTRRGGNSEQFIVSLPFEPNLYDLPVKVKPSGVVRRKAAK